MSEINKQVKLGVEITSRGGKDFAREAADMTLKIRNVMQAIKDLTTERRTAFAEIKRQAEAEGRVTQEMEQLARVTADTLRETKQLGETWRQLAKNSQFLAEQTNLTDKEIREFQQTIEKARLSGDYDVGHQIAYAMENIVDKTKMAEAALRNFDVPTNIPTQPIERYANELEDLEQQAWETEQAIVSVHGEGGMPPPPPAWIENETRELQQLEQQAKRTEQAVREVATASASAAGGMPNMYGTRANDPLGKAIATVKTPLAAGWGDIRAFARDAAAETRKFTDVLTGVTKAEDLAAAAALDMGEDTQVATSKMGQGFSYLKGAVTNALAFGIMAQVSQAAQAIKQFANDSIESFATVEFELAKIAAQTPNLSQGFGEEMEAEVRRVAKAIGYLPEEVLPTVRKALNLGVDEKNIFTTIVSTANAARIAGAPLEETLVAAQTAVNAYGDELIDVNRVLDQYAYITQNSNLEQQDLNAGLAAIINPAAEAGVAIEDVSAAIVTMSRQGDSFDEIGQMLTNFFVQAQIPTTALGKAIREAAGADFTDLMNQGMTLSEVMTILSKHADEAGVSMTALVAGQGAFFRDQQASLAATELSGRHQEELAIQTEGAAKAYGLIDDAVKKVNDTMQVSNDKTEAAVAASKIVIGQALEPQKREWNQLKLAVFEYIEARAQAALDNRGEGEAYYQDRSREINALKMGIAATDMYARQVALILKQNYEASDKGIADVDKYIGALQKLQQLELGGGMDSVPLPDQYLYGLAAAEDKQAEAFATGGPLENMANIIERQRPVLERAVASVEPIVERYTAIFKNAKDGDTFKLEIEGELVDIRLAGVDTPETPKEWEDELIKRLGMPQGDTALEFATNVLMNGEVSVGPKLADSFEREVREVFVDGKRLSTMLAAEGLAVPMIIDLDDETAIAEITAAYQAAAEARKGIFSNEGVRDAFMAGEIDSIKDIIPYWEHLAVASQEYTKNVLSGNTALEAFITASEDLATYTEGQNVQEEKQALVDAEAALTEDYVQMALDRVVADRGATDGVLDYMVALGQMTEAEKEQRVAYAQNVQNMDEFGAAAAENMWNAEVFTQALQGLADGYYATADEAIAAANANQQYADALEAAGGNEELADKIMQQAIAYDAVAAAAEAARIAVNAQYDEFLGRAGGDGDLADKLFRSRDKTTGATATPELDIDIAPWVLKMDAVNEDLTFLQNGGQAFTSTLDLDTETFFENKMAFVTEAIGGYVNENKPYTAKIDADSGETLTEIGALQAAATSYATDYHAYIYTHNVMVDDPSTSKGNQAGGGFINESGVYTVGEFGYEDVYLPRGSQVVPHEDVNRGRSLTIMQTVNGSAAGMDDANQQLLRALRKVGFRP